MTRNKKVYMEDARNFRIANCDNHKRPTPTRNRPNKSLSKFCLKSSETVFPTTHKASAAFALAPHLIYAPLSE